jgi:hypothetical protein
MNVDGKRTIVVTAVRWCARLWAAILFLFWGAFFSEHLGEWFFRATEWPPIGVSDLMGLHFLMLAGLLTGWRWEFAGGLLVLGAATAFFSQAAGPNAVPFTLVTIAPAVAWVGLSVEGRRSSNIRRTQQSAS